jgi:amino acid transporter
MIYAASRQAFSLGRAGYLPRFLGAVHPTRRTPYVSLAVWTAVVILFIVFGHFHVNATAIAILISTLTAVVWYVLAIACLFLLRHKEPDLFRPYKVPGYPWVPSFVALLSVTAAFLYVWVNVKVIVPTACLFIAAALWYGLWARKKVLPVAPEEVTARIAAELARQQRPATPADLSQPPSSSAVVIERPTGPILMPADPLYRRKAQALLERVMAPVLLLGLLSLFWMILRSLGVRVWALSEPVEVTLALAVWGLLFIIISAIGLLSTLRDN